MLFDSPRSALVPHLFFSRNRRAEILLLRRRLLFSPPGLFERGLALLFSWLLFVFVVLTETAPALPKLLLYRSSFPSSKVSFFAFSRYACMVFSFPPMTSSLECFSRCVGLSFFEELFSRVRYSIFFIMPFLCALCH